MKPFMIAACVLLIAGCASGPHYWTRQDATDARFQIDHRECFDAAYVGYGAGNEAAYKGCMYSKGWSRIQGTGTQPPSVPYFRGPEGDDDFGPLSSDELKAKIQHREGRERISGEAYQCERGRGYAQRPPPGVVCP
jgi:hypothetical protein